MKKKIFIVIIILIFTGFLFKNLILEYFIAGYIEKTFEADCEIEKTGISLRGIEVKNLTFTKEGIYLKFGEAHAEFGLDHSGSRAIDIRNAALELKDRNNLNIAAKFSFKGSIRNNNIYSIDDVEISACNLRYGTVGVKNLNLNKEEDNLYTLRISCLKIKGKEIKNILIPMRIGKDKIVLEKAGNSFLGDDSSFKGILEFEYPEFISLNMGLNKVSFENAAAMINDDVVLKGLFEGELTICFGKAGVSKIEGYFCNKDGGVINIEKELPLNFFEKYIDKRSRKTLVDGFKDYDYNKGIIMLNKKGEDLHLEMKFDSDRMGERNIEIIFHKR